MRTEERTASTNSLSMGTAEVLGWTSRRRPKRRGTDGMMRGGRTRGFGGFDGGEEVIEFRLSVVRPGVNLIVLFAQAARRAIV